MSATIDQAFVKQFQAEVHEAFQRQGSKLRPTVRSKTGVNGASTVFPRVGKGVAAAKSRNGAVTVMNLDYSAVECFLQDYYAGEWVDKLDDIKTNVDERAIVANAGAYALSRKTDELIISALDTGVQEAVGTASVDGPASIPVGVDAGDGGDGSAAAGSAAVARARVSTTATVSPPAADHADCSTATPSSSATAWPCRRR